MALSLAVMLAPGITPPTRLDVFTPPQHKGASAHRLEALAQTLADQNEGFFVYRVCPPCSCIQVRAEFWRRMQEFYEGKALWMFSCSALCNSFVFVPYLYPDFTPPHLHCTMGGHEMNYRLPFSH